MVVRPLLALLLASSLLLFGCPDGDDDDSSGDDDVSDDDTGDDDTGDDDTAPPTEPYLAGYLYDVTCTTPLADVRVTFCQESCMFKQTDASGRYVFDGLDPVSGVLDVVGHINSDGAYYTGTVEEYDIPATGSVEVGDTCLPEIPSVQELGSGPQLVEVGDGLELTFDPDDVEWVLGIPQIGAVEVPESAWRLVDIEGVDVTAVWAFYVWGSVAANPIETAMPMLGDVTCDDQVMIYWMSVEDHGFELVGEADKDCDLQTVSTPAGLGLPEFTWVAYGVPGS